MIETTIETGENATIRTQFVIEQSWSGHEWRAARGAYVASSIEGARAVRDRYAADCAAGKIFDLEDKYGEAVPMPELRIRQKVTVYSVVE